MVKSRLQTQGDELPPEYRDIVRLFRQECAGGRICRDVARSGDGCCIVVNGAIFSAYELAPWFMDSNGNGERTVLEDK